MNYKTTINKVQNKYRKVYSDNKNFVIGFLTGVLVSVLVTLII